VWLPRASPKERPVTAKRPPPSETQPPLLLVDPRLTTPSSSPPLPSSARLSTPASRRTSTPASLSRSLASVSTSPAKLLPPKLQRLLLAAADQRRRSGKTLEERMADLSSLVLDIAKHFPADGMHLLEFSEELADAVKLQLQPPSS
jgi:hypothetical protein